MARFRVLSRTLMVLAILISACSLSSGQETIQSALHAKLEAQLASVAEHLNGVMGYAIKDESTGEMFTRLPDAVFPQASSIKLTVLLELMRQAQEGKISLDEEHKLRRAEMTRGDTEPILTMLGDGTVTLSLHDLAIFMVVLSPSLQKFTNVFLRGQHGVPSLMRRLARS